MIEHLDILLDIACALIFRVVVFEGVCPCPKQRLLRSEGRFDVILGPSGHLFADLTLPQGPVLRHFLRRWHVRLVERVVEAEGRWLRCVCCKVRARLDPSKPVRTTSKGTANAALLLKREGRYVLCRWQL